MPVRVLIVEDQRIVREGLIAVLEDDPGLEIVGEAADGQMALEHYARLLPDVVLMDVQMPVMDGPTAIRALRATWPAARVLVLTTYATDDFIGVALKAGAKGYLLKDASADELRGAIHAVAAGQTPLAPAVMARLVAGIGQGAVENLTVRELEVLQLLGQGATNSQIALHLQIALRTAKVHVQNILGKLGAANRTEAVRIALQQRLITIDPDAPPPSGTHE
ncbi:MAG TPA: response regulator transcription factor [Herpetosiphonaceae bacterium]|nr:response regulator transcription factor [Herpetosiphonaceae bacterium]